MRKTRLSLRVLNIYIDLSPIDNFIFEVFLA